MTRRSPEVVDGALGFQHHGSPRDASYVWEALDILADEVRALREDCERYTSRGCTVGVGDGGGGLFVHGKYEAVKRVQDMVLTIARVEALAGDLRTRDQGDMFPREAAAEIEAALKGEP